VAGHLLGFTNIDDLGQEGIELLYNDWLVGRPGSKRVLRDRLGRVIRNVESLRPPRPGQTLRLALDRRIQYLAYRELKAAVQHHQARSGSVVILDARSGEVLAMVNQPAYNPNNRQDLESSRYRNRAVTDLFEPGSTMKPFTIAAALESGRYTPDTPVETGTGLLRVGSDTVRDTHPYGLLDVTGVIRKSSNVGAARIALSLEAEQLYRTFSRFGFGRITGSGFPGESDGRLRTPEGWRAIEQATLSFGYGLSVTPLQLAQAYTVFAGDGRLRPATFLPVERGAVDPVPVIAPETARQVRRMLETVTETGGTGTRARVPGYRVAGKTGTVRKAGANGYSDDRYVSLFAGMAPASSPRLVMVVVLNEPRGEHYYGGLVAAPVFSRVMAGALRLLDVPPDDLDSLQGQLAMLEGQP